MKCPKCQFENPEGIIFCGKCASKLEFICPKCNFSNPSDFIFCGKCAYNLSTPSETPRSELSKRYPQLTHPYFKITILSA
jgi:ribosomal protein L40E